MTHFTLPLDTPSLLPLLTITRSVQTCTLSPSEAYGRLSALEAFALVIRFGTRQSPLIAMKPRISFFQTLSEANQALAKLQVAGQKGLCIGLAHFDAYHRQEPDRLPPAEKPITLYQPALYVELEKNAMRMTYQSHEALAQNEHQRRADQLFCSVMAALEREQPPIERTLCQDAVFRSSLKAEEYADRLSQAKAYIEAGDIFQVVLSNTFQANLQIDPLTLFNALVLANPSEYALLLKDSDRHLLITSPEMMVSQTVNEVVTTPIAGTRAVKNDGRDEARVLDLLADEKERAEHLMLVDLARNDLSRAAEPDSVTVENYCSVKRLSRVMHLASTVKGKTLTDAGPLEALIRTFPAGTVSGAPKIRAAQIIHELEPHRRDYYAGSVFLNDYGHSLESCITIRTIVHTKDSLTLQIGSGIVYDSNMADESKELINKGKALFEAIENTIEGRVSLDFGH